MLKYDLFKQIVPHLIGASGFDWNSLWGICGRCISAGCNCEAWDSNSSGKTCSNPSDNHSYSAGSGQSVGLDEGFCDRR